MRVAVLFSGHLRTGSALAEFHWDTLQRLSGLASVRVFVHSWISSDDSLEHAKVQEFCEHLSVEANNFQVETPRHFAPVRHLGVRGRPSASRLAAGSQSMWAGVAAAYALAVRDETLRAETYDLFIRTRPDAVWDMIGETARSLESGRSYLPRRTAVGVMPSDTAGVLTRRDAATYFGDLHDRHVIESVLLSSQMESFVPEYVLGHYLAGRGVEWQPFSDPVMLYRNDSKRVAIRSDPLYLRYMTCRAYMLHGDDQVFDASDKPRMLARELGRAVGESLKPADDVRLLEVARSVPRAPDLSREAVLSFWTVIQSLPSRLRYTVPILGLTWGVLRGMPRRHVASVGRHPMLLCAVLLLRGFVRVLELRHDRRMLKRTDPNGRLPY